MNKKTYTSPSMNTIMLRQRFNLLTISGVEVRRSGYGTAETESWD